MVLCFAALYRLVNSRVGRLFAALRQNEDLASSMGLNVPALRVLAYAISSFFGGIGGAIFVAIAQSIYPSSFTVNDSVNFMLNCFLGGLGYVFGPMLGTLVLYFGWDLLFQTRRLPAPDLFGRHDPPHPHCCRTGFSACGCACSTGAVAMAPILKVTELTKRYGGLVAVNEVSFDVEPNEILSIIGPNGAGKSTIFKLISSFVKPTRGEVTFKGEVISGLAPHTVARKGVVRTFQETTIFKGYDGARQRHRRPSPSLAREPVRLLSSVRRWRAATKRSSAVRATESSSFWVSARSRTRSPATCRRAICARSASPSALRPIRRFCCSTSRSPA